MTVSHGLVVCSAVDRLASLPIRRLLVTDTVMLGPIPGPPLQVQSVAGLLADATGGLHESEQPGDLLMRT